MKDRCDIVVIMTVVVTICTRPESLGWGLVVALIINTIRVSAYLVSQSDSEKFRFSSLKFVFKEKQIFEALKFVPLISLKENFTPFSESVKQMRTCKRAGPL